MTARAYELYPSTPTRQRLSAMSDSELATEAVGGDERLFREIVERYQKRLLNFIYYLIADREKAEDLVQEAFVRVSHHLHRYNPEQRFSTWIYSIAKNLAKNELRNRSRDRVVLFQAFIKGHWNMTSDSWNDLDMPLEFEDVRVRPDDMYHKRHLIELVENTVAHMPEHHRQIFQLRELQGKTYEEIANITNCKLGTVKSRLNRARRSFASIIEPSYDKS